MRTLLGSVSVNLAELRRAGGDFSLLCYVSKTMKISPSTIAGVLVAIMVVGFLCGLVYVVNYLLSQR